MIVSSISAGLGNQLFQYAFGRVLSSYHDVPLKTDLYWFTHEQNNSHRQYGLTHFDIQAPEISWRELDEYIHADTRFHRFTRPYYKRIRIHERSLAYDPNVWKFPKRTYVLGYWQAWKYYDQYHDALRSEFKIVTPPSESAVRLLADVQKPHSVAIHIRRGDYMTNTSFNTLPLSYYATAITYLQERHVGLHWYVFSDDIKWVKEHLRTTGSVTYVEGLSDIDDFRIMLEAQHIVIANSTFSWWSAWLKPLNSGIIIAPKTPFSNPALVDGDTLYPPHFVRI